MDGRGAFVQLPWVIPHKNEESGGSIVCRYSELVAMLLAGYLVVDGAVVQAA